MILVVNAWTMLHMITVGVRRSRGEMYSGHGRLCVCLSLAAFPYYCTDPDVTWEWQGYPVVVHYYWADLESENGFRSYDNNSAEREMSASACTRSLYAWLISCL